MYADPEVRREYHRKWRENNRHKVNSAQIKYKHGKLERLAGRPRPDTCEVCGHTVKICWDHDHETGEFRGWICSGCNTVLGIVDDDPALLRKLADYLEANR